MLVLGRSRSPMLVGLGGLFATLLVVLGFGLTQGLLAVGAEHPVGRSPQATATLAPIQGRPLPPGARLLPDRATASSSTYVLPGGSMVTRVSTAPVNYRDGAGGWRPVDPRLTARGDAFVNRGAAFSLSLPRRLSDGVAMSSGSGRLHMRLHGAGGTAAVSGVRATYADVLPSVTAIYDSQAQGVREQLVIADRSAPRTFRFSLQASAGLVSRLHRDGSITFTREGRTVFLLPPAVTFPEGDDGDFHPAHSELRRAAGGWVLTVTPDRAWVLRELEHGPVVLDPTVEIDPDSQDCSMDSSNPTTSYCSSTHLPVGYEASANAHEHRALVQFDLSVLPKDAVVLNADFGLTLGAHSTNTLKQVGVYQAKRAWTNSATWNKYNATSSWATAGAGGTADAEGSPAAVVTTGDTSGFVNWYPTKLVQGWLDGAQPNYGFLIRDVSPGTVDNELDFSSREGGSVTPELDIVWAPRTGQIDSYTFESQALTDSSRLDVNVANGNLVLASHDLHVAGTGMDLDLTRFHNSMGTGWGDQAMGIPSTLSLGRDVKLQQFADGSVAFFRGDGVVLPFLNRSVSGGTATFTAPSDLDASLSENTSTGVYTLTFNATQTRYIFDTDGRLTSVKDQNDNTISLAYHTTGFHGLSQVTDTQGRTYAVGETPYDDFLSDITDPSGHVWNYTYGDYNNDYLTDYEDPAGNHTLYAYDASHRLIAITTPDGEVTKITYDGTSQRVASIKRTTDPGHTTGPTTTFTYSSPTSPCQSTNFDYIKTVVNRPDNSSTTYCANDHAQVTYDTDNPTIATPSGEWYDLRDDYTQGTGTHSITLAGADAGAGVKKLALEEVGGAEIAAVTLPCDPRNPLAPTACPHTSTKTVTFDPSGLAEGSHSFRQVTTDFAGRTAASAPWVVNVDRSAPSLSSDVDAMLGDDGLTTIYLGDAADPDLPGGVPGSGIGLYSYRYQVGGGAWSAWTATSAPAFTIPGLVAGQVVSVQATVADQVGNVSAVASGTATVIQAFGFEDREVVSDAEVSDPVGPSTCYPDPEFPDGYCGDDETGDANAALRAVLPTTGWGLSDNNRSVDIFADARLDPTKVTWYRRVVPWNIAVVGPAAEAKHVAGQPLTEDEELNRRFWGELKGWLASVAQQDGVSGAPAHPLISFERCAGTFAHLANGVTTQAPCRTTITPHVVAVAPTVAEYRAAVQAFLQDPSLASVHDFTAWNEPNHGKFQNEYQPTWDNPKLAGQYWRALDTLCRAQAHQCRVGAGDFLDNQMQNAAGGPTAGGARYMNLYKQGMGYPSKAKYWAWHAYSDGEDALKRSSSDRWIAFRHFLRATNYSGSPDVWLTEQGVVFHANGKPHPAANSTRFANNIMRAYVSDSSALTKVSTRTKRFFYYQWVGEPSPGHDSGLISYSSNLARDLYTIYKAATT